jgi:hypothetical protein
VSTTLLGGLLLLAGGLLAAPVPASAQEIPEPAAREHREREILRLVRKVFLEGLTHRVGVDEEQLARLLPILEDLEGRRQESRQRREALVLQLRGLVQDPEADEGEILRKLKDLEKVERDLHQDEKHSMEAIKGLLTVRQQAKFHLFREEFRRRLEQRMRDHRREAEQRRAMREGMRRRREAEGRTGEERP